MSRPPPPSRRRPTRRSIRSVWSRRRSRLDDRGLALGEQAGEQHARLDLGARDRQLVGDPAKRRAVDAQRWQAARRGTRRSAPISRSGSATRSHRAAADRLVAVERPAPAGCPASQPGAGSAAACPRCRRRCRPRRRGRPGRAARCRRSSSSQRLRRRPAGSSTAAPSARHRRERRERVGRAQVAVDLGARPRPSRRGSRRGGRSTCPAAAAARPRSGPAGSKRAVGQLLLADRRRRRVAEPAHHLGGALGLALARDPQRDRARSACRRAGYSAMSSMLTPARPSASASSATMPGRFGTADAQLAQRAADELGLEQAAAVLARAAMPVADGVAVARAQELGRPRRGALDDARRSRRATASRLAAKMSAQIAGLAPATRVVSRKLGPTSGQPLGLLGERGARPAGRARWRARAGRWLTVAIRRSCVVGVDRLRPGAELGDRALQAVVVHAARALGRASGTSARPRTGRRARARRRRSRRRRADGRR